MNTRKKNSKRTGTISSKTHSVEPAIDGLGGTLPSQMQEWREAFMSALDANDAMSQTKKRKQTTSIPLSTPCEVLKDGTIIHRACWLDWRDGKYCVPYVTASKPEPKTSFAEKCECDPSKQHYCLEPKESKGLKYDSEKPRMSLLAPAGLLEEAKGMTYGAKKYGDYNWRKGINITRYLSAALRHILAVLSGEYVDRESGVSHLGLAKCNLGMAIQTLEDRPDLNDLYKKEEI